MGYGLLYVSFKIRYKYNYDSWRWVKHSEMQRHFPFQELLISNTAYRFGSCARQSLTECMATIFSYGDVHT